MDPRLEKLAKVLVGYSADVKPGNWVLIRAGVESLPLTNLVVGEVLRLGANPSVLFTSDEIDETILRTANGDQLAWISPIDQLYYDTADVLITIRSSNNTRSLTGVDPKKQTIQQNARRHLQQTFMQRAARKDLHWTLTQYPCPAYAQEADMSLHEYEDFIYGATFCDQPDPVAKWLEVHAVQQRMVDWLKGKDKVVVKGPNVDLTLSIKDRVFVNSSGKQNMPSGEIFTGPVEDSVNGWVRFTYPALRGGREVDGVELHFRNGKVSKAQARKNESYLISQINSDPGASYLGEFAIGTNFGIQRFTKNILFDEKIGGTMHMALGAGYPETGSKNVSGLHWDFICDMRTDSEIVIDGELFYQNGEFKI